MVPISSSDGEGVYRSREGGELACLATPDPSYVYREGEEQGEIQAVRKTMDPPPPLPSPAVVRLAG